MDLLHRLLTVQVLAILGTFLGEAVASELLVAAAVSAFAVAVPAMFAQMTGSLLSGLAGSTGPDMAVDSRQ